MIICLSRLADGNILAQASVEDFGMSGDIRNVIKPGEDFFGYTFAEIAALGDGEHNIDEKE